MCTPQPAQTTEFTDQITEFNDRKKPRRRYAGRPTYSRDPPQRRYRSRQHGGGSRRATERQTWGRGRASYVNKYERSPTGDAHQQVRTLGNEKRSREAKTGYDSGLFFASKFKSHISKRCGRSDPGADLAEDELSQMDDELIGRSPKKI